MTDFLCEVESCVTRSEIRGETRREMGSLLRVYLYPSVVVVP